MLAIRLKRTGSKKRPLFRIVVTDSASAPESSVIEVLGHYNPRTTPETLDIKRERLEHWLKRGAQSSDTVRTLVARMPDAASLAAEAGAKDSAGGAGVKDSSAEALAKADQPAS